MKSRDIHVHLHDGFSKSSPHELHFHLHQSGMATEVTRATSAGFIGLQSVEYGAMDRHAPLAPEETIAPSVYRLTALESQVTESSRVIMSDALKTLLDSEVLLEKLGSNGHSLKVWESTSPPNADRVWQFNLVRSHDAMLGALTLKTRPFAWLTLKWRPDGPVILEPANPPDLIDRVPRLLLTPR